MKTILFFAGVATVATGLMIGTLVWLAGALDAWDEENHPWSD